MTLKSLVLLLSAASLVFVSAASGATSSPGDAAVDDAVREAVRRQAFKIELQQKLAGANELLQKGDHTGAAQLYEQCLVLVRSIGPGVEEEHKQVMSGLASSRLQLAHQARQRGDLLEADRQLRALLVKDAKNEPALALYETNAKELKAQEGRRPTDQTLSLLPEIHQTNVLASTLVQDAKVLYEAGQLDKAVEKLRDAIKTDPNNRAAFYYLDKVMEQRFANESNLRESLSKKMILNVTEAWNAPIKREALPVPNPYARTNLVYTGKGRQVIFDKLNRIKINEIQWDGVPLGEVMKALTEEARKRDPERLGINFMASSTLEPTAPPAQPVDATTGQPLPQPPQEPIDLSTTIIRIMPPLTDVTLAQVLDAIVKVADRPIKFSVEDYAVIFSVRPQEAAALYTRWFKVDPNTFFQGMQGVTSLDFGAGGGGSSGSGRGGSSRSGGSSSRSGGGSFGGGGGFDSGGGGQGSEYVGVSLAGASRRSSRSGGGSLGGGFTPPQVTGTGGAAGSAIGAQGGGVRFLTQESPVETIIEAVRRFFTVAGVDLAPPKAIFFNDRLGMLMVRASMQDLDIVEQAIQVLNMAPPQVQIEAKFAEITQDDTRALGFDWLWGNTLVNDGKIGVQGGTAPSFGYNPFDPLNSPAASPANPSGVFPGPFFGPGFVLPSATDNLVTGGLRNSAGAGAVMTVTGILTDPQFRVVVRALDQREGIDLLSAPKVTTLSSRQTQIKIVDIRYIVVDLDLDQTSSGGTTASTIAPIGSTGGGVVGSSIQPISEPYELGPVLDVVPYVSADGYTVQMTVIPTIKEFVGYDLKSAQLFQPQVQSVGGGGAANPLTTTTPLPIFRLRQVVTSAVVWDGQTVVLGGLISENVTKVKDKVPILGDLPLAGRLFRSESNMTKKKNLVIFVTPTIIDPAGNRVHAEEELPFAQNTVPPQTPVVPAATAMP